MNTKSKRIWRKLREKAYREHLVEEMVKRGIPFQMRALLKRQGISQGELAKRAGLTQGVISRALNPHYGNLTLNTLVRIAAGLDVAFMGTFVPFSELARQFDELSEESVGRVQTFPVEDEFYHVLERVGLSGSDQHRAQSAGYETATDVARRQIVAGQSYIEALEMIPRHQARIHVNQRFGVVAESVATMEA